MAIQNALTAVMTLKDKTANYDPKAQIIGLLGGPGGGMVLGALQRLGFVHFARFCFIDIPERTVKFKGESVTVPGETKFAIITSYDFDFDDYMNIFIDELGVMFDTMLEHVKDAPPLPVRKHRAEFIEHVKSIDLTHPDIVADTAEKDPAKKRNLGFAIVFSAYPDLTVQQIWKMQEETYA